jgi:hypothetical protein
MISYTISEKVLIQFLGTVLGYDSVPLMECTFMA